MSAGVADSDGVISTVLSCDRRLAKALASTTFFMASGSPSPAMPTASAISSPAMASILARRWLVERQNTTVESAAKSSRLTPFSLLSSPEAGSIEISSTFRSESCVSTLKVRIESMSSSKKSIR